METLDVQMAGLLPTGGMEWVLILAVLLLLFGGTKLPALAKGLGQSIKEFKKASKEEDPPAPAGKEDPKKTDTAGTHGSN
jgi:sec-independent protein translocase protein TatA